MKTIVRDGRHFEVELHTCYYDYLRKDYNDGYIDKKQYKEFLDFTYWFVQEKEICPCCNQGAKVIFSCGGIASDSAEEAVEEFLAY